MLKETLGKFADLFVYEDENSKVESINEGFFRKGDSATLKEATASAVQSYMNDLVVSGKLEPKAYEHANKLLCEAKMKWRRDESTRITLCFI